MNRRAEDRPLANPLRPILGVLANVTVLTALLIFIGWQRNYVQSSQLGVAESVFAASTQDYVLRSAASARTVLISIGVLGLAWVLLDRWLVPLVRADPERNDSRVRWTLRVMTFAWTVPTVLAVVYQGLQNPYFHIFGRIAIAVGFLLLLYSNHLRQLDQVQDLEMRRRTLVLQVSGVLLAGVCLFWSATAYATYEGVRLAREMEVGDLLSIVIHSPARLGLEGPGVVETEVSEVEGDFRYRYSGLRLLEYANSKYFLLPEGWTIENGVIFVMPDGSEEIRYEFVH